VFRAGILKSLWGLGTEEEEGYRTGPPGYIGWRNSFLGTDSGAPYTFKIRALARALFGPPSCKRIGTLFRSVLHHEPAIYFHVDLTEMEMGGR
jgi:hypothetical protein